VGGMMNDTPDIPSKFLGIRAIFRTWVRTEICSLFLGVGIGIGIEIEGISRR